MVPHLGGIFSEVKSLRSRAQGPKISRSLQGQGPRVQRKTKSTNKLRTTRRRLRRHPPSGARFERPSLGGFVVLSWFVDLVFLWTLGTWPWSEATYLWALGPGAKRLNFGKYAPEVGDHFLLLKVSENTL